MGNDNRWKQLAQMMAAVIVNEMREQLKNGKPQDDISVRYMTIEQCSVYIGRSVTAIYRLVSKARDSVHSHWPELAFRPRGNRWLAAAQCASMCMTNACSDRISPTKRRKGRPSRSGISSV